jgi:CheY-like chemotaxis protein
LYIHSLSPRAQRAYTSLRERILQGELLPGTKLPSHLELAGTFGIAPLTMRQVLAHLDEEGLVSREQGRGTFVRARLAPGVLIVEDDAEMRALLRLHVTQAGYRALQAGDPVEALALLEQDKKIALIFSDVRMPTQAEGVEFIRAVARRWPDLPLAAITGYPDDLSGLHGTRECPILILAKPIWSHQIDRALRLAIPGARVR